MNIRCVMRINGKFILIIDDDQAMLRALTKVLAAEGGLVTSAGWAGEAMDHLKDGSEGFDLVITDLRMPILGGEAILSAVKTALPWVPVIVITAFGNPEVKAECLNQGAAAFLEKPLETDQLLQAIHNALAPTGKHRAQPSDDGKRADKSGGPLSRLERDPFKPWGET